MRGATDLTTGGPTINMIGKNSCKLARLYFIALTDCGSVASDPNVPDAGPIVIVDASADAQPDAPVTGLDQASDAGSGPCTWDCEVGQYVYCTVDELKGGRASNRRNGVESHST